jgi:hypothetical protein
MTAKYSLFAITALSLASNLAMASADWKQKATDADLETCFYAVSRLGNDNCFGDIAVYEKTDARLLNPLIMVPYTFTNKDPSLWRAQTATGGYCDEIECPTKKERLVAVEARSAGESALCIYFRGEVHPYPLSVDKKGTVLSGCGHQHIYGLNFPKFGESCKTIPVLPLRYGTNIEGNLRTFNVERHIDGNTLFTTNGVDVHNVDRVSEVTSPAIRRACRGALIQAIQERAGAIKDIRNGSSYAQAYASQVVNRCGGVDERFTQILKKSFPALVSPARVGTSAPAATGASPATD